jgi:hypothetical protein
MAWVSWEPLKRKVCDRVGEEVALEARLIFPSDILPDQPPRVTGHRCSRWATCNALDQPTCCWAGTLPGYDPFV